MLRGMIFRQFPLDSESVTNNEIMISFLSFIQYIHHRMLCKVPAFNLHLEYYTIIDFNEVDIRIYLPEKVIIHRGR